MASSEMGRLHKIYNYNNYSAMKLSITIAVTVKLNVITTISAQSLLTTTCSNNLQSEI